MKGSTVLFGCAWGGGCLLVCLFVVGFFLFFCFWLLLLFFLVDINHVSNFQSKETIKKAFKQSKWLHHFRQQLWEWCR